MSLKSFAIGSIAFLGAITGLAIFLPSSKQRNQRRMFNLPASPRNYSTHKRSEHDIRWIVIHSTDPPYIGSKPPDAQPSARATARYFASPEIRDRNGNPAPVSSHIVIDDKEIIRSVPDDHIAYTVGKANGFTLNIEIAGYAAWTRLQWLDHPETLSNVAEVIAAWCIKYKIAPIPYFTQTPHLDMLRGITSHVMVNAYYKGTNGNHTDPGPNFPHDILMSMVADILEGPSEYVLDV